MATVVQNRVSTVTCDTVTGAHVTGPVLHCTPHAVAFEVYGPEVVLHTSEVLDNLQIVLHGQKVFAGRAVVSSLVSAGPRQVCEARLESGRLRSGGLPSGELETDWTGAFRSFLREWEHHFGKIQPDYKRVVTDMHSLFSELRLWLDEQELALQERHGPAWPRVEKEVVAQLTPAILPVIDQLFERFELVAGTIDPALGVAHAEHMRQMLHPLVLASPFAHRTFTKPLGYAGDYEMVNMLARDPREGPSLFGKVFNVWFIEQPPARAHRNRLDYLVQTLVQEALRTRRQGRALRVLNLACGPALEVQRFLDQYDLDDPIEMTLLDFNDETLEHARQRLQAIIEQRHRKCRLRFLKRSVQDVLKQASRAQSIEPAYDLAYCAGLFDYLADPVCQRVMDLLYSQVVPGGLVVATNVDPSNPLKHGMAHLLDWNLIHRRAADLRGLKPSAAPEEAVSVEADLTGVNVFITVRKPLDGER